MPVSQSLFLARVRCPISHLIIVDIKLDEPKNAHPAKRQSEAPRKLYRAEAIGPAGRMANSVTRMSRNLIMTGPARIQTERRIHERSGPGAIIQRLNDCMPPCRREQRQELFTGFAQGIAAPVDNLKALRGIKL